MITSGMREAFRWAYGEEEEFCSCCPEAEEVERYGVLHMDPVACDRQSPESAEVAERIGGIRFVAYRGRVFIVRSGHGDIQRDRDVRRGGIAQCESRPAER